MKHAVQYTKVSRRLLMEVDNPMMVVDLPPEPWFVKGPRGGWYVATGERERLIGETANDWDMNTLTVTDRSHGIRYLRPGTRLYNEAVAS